MIGFVRPPLIIEEFVGADGKVIPYGQRWLDNDRNGPDDTYSVTVHPQRFQPLVDFAHALVGHLAATYLVRREEPDQQTVLLLPDNPNAAPLKFEFDQTPMVRVTAGRSSSIAWFCPCDHCDEDVAVTIESLEQEVAAVVDGGLREWLNDPAAGYVGDDLFLADALSSADGAVNQSHFTSVDNEMRRQELRQAYADIPTVWSPWALRNR